MRIKDSGGNHWPAEDVLHAIRHPIRIKEDLRPGVTLIIGGSRDGQLLEILIDTSEAEPAVFHADTLRERLRKQFLEGG